jgi:single-strand DNA-binding protein
MSVNKVILVGNLGRDPEVRYLPSGQPVANFSVATTSRAKGPDGQYQDATEWHNVVVFGKQAEFCSQYLKKGRLVSVDGRLRTRQWEAKDGSGKRSRTEVVAERVGFVGGRGDGAGGARGGGRAGAGGTNEQEDFSNDMPPAGPDDDDIPF